MRTELRIGLLVSAVVALATCDGGPTAGELEVHLTAATGGVQAVRFSVTGTESRMVESAEAACAGCQLFTARFGDRELRGVVIGAMTPGPLLRILVSDAGEPAAYSAAVVEAADAGYGLLDAGEFRLEVRGRR